MMTDEEIKVVFCNKIIKNFDAFYDDWLAMTPEELIENSAFVQATKAMYNYYKDGCRIAEAMRYLIGFENPLEILRDGIVCDMDGDINSIDNSLWEIYDRRSADHDYEKDYKYYEAPKSDQCMPFGM